MELILIRHGVTQGNLEKRYIGQRHDQSLAPVGISRLKEYSARGRYPQADIVYSSPLKRCVETARLIYPGMTPVVLPALTELDFGSFDGKNYEELKDDPAYRQWIDSAGMTAPTGGESGAAFIARLEGALRQIAGDVQRLNLSHPVVVLHGGCIMTILSQLADRNLPGGGDFYQYLLENGGGYQVEMDPETLQITQIRSLE